jgi:repressor of nif and glnA expression
VSSGRAGAIVIGGLNPMAIFEELGIRVQARALSGLLEYNRLFPYQELTQRLAVLRAGMDENG